MNIKEITDKFADLLRPNRYQVEIIPPAKLKKLYDNSKDYDRVLDLFNYLTVSASFPFETIESFTSDVLNKKFQIAMQADYDALELGFNLDSEGLILDFFQKWKSLIVDNYNRVGYFDDYVGEINLKLLDRQNKQVFEANLVGAYPANRGNISLGNQQENTFTEQTISFRFLKAFYSRSGKFYITDEVEDFSKTYAINQTENFSLGGYNPTGSDFMIFDVFSGPANNTIQNCSQQVTEALDRLRIDTLSKVKIPSIGILNNSFQSLVNSQYNQLSTTKIIEPLQTKVSEIQSTITKKYKELQKKAVDRLQTSIKTSISKIFKF